MPISFTCACGKRMKAPDNLAGRKVKCPACKKGTVIPYPACLLDETCLALVRPFMAADADPDDFPHGCITKKTAAYACGALGREGDTLEHTHSPAELELCQRLAAEAVKVAESSNVNVNTAGTPTTGTDPLTPFFIAANKGDKVVPKLSDDFVRKKFGGVIFPQCPIVIEPLKEKGAWWAAVLRDCGGNESALLPWRKLVEWFNAQRDFQESAFIRFGPTDQDGKIRFPRFVLGFTNDGSLVGFLDRR